MTPIQITASLAIIAETAVVFAKFAVIYALVLFIFIGIGGVSMRGFSYNLFFYSLIFGIPYGYLAYYTFISKEGVTDNLAKSPEFVIPSAKDIRKK